MKLLSGFDGVKPVSAGDSILLGFGKGMFLLAAFISALGLVVVAVVGHLLWALWGASQSKPHSLLSWTALTLVWLGSAWCMPLVGRSSRSLSYTLRAAVWRRWPRLAEGSSRESVRTLSIVAVAPIAFAMWLALCLGLGVAVSVVEHAVR